MPHIDLLLAAELLVVLLLVATMDAPFPRLKAADPALVSSDIRFWSSGDTKTGPPDGLLMGA